MLCENNSSYSKCYAPTISKILSYKGSMKVMYVKPIFVIWMEMITLRMSQSLFTFC